VHVFHPCNSSAEICKFDVRRKSALSNPAIITSNGDPRKDAYFIDLAQTLACWGLFALLLCYVGSRSGCKLMVCKRVRRDLWDLEARLRSQENQREELRFE
jgi:hypothetical protein